MHKWNCNCKYFATYFSHTLPKLVLYTGNIMRHRSPYSLLSAHHIPNRYVRSHRKQDLEFRLSFDCFRSAASVHYTYYFSSTAAETTSFSINWFSVFLILISINQQTYCYIYIYWLKILYIADIQPVSQCPLNNNLPYKVFYMWLCEAICNCVHC